MSDPRRDLEDTLERIVLRAKDAQDEVATLRARLTEAKRLLGTVTDILDSIVPAGDELDEPIENAVRDARAFLAAAKEEGK